MIQDLWLKKFDKIIFVTGIVFASIGVLLVFYGFVAIDIFSFNTNKVLAMIGGVCVGVGCGIGLTMYFVSRHFQISGRMK